MKTSRFELTEYPALLGVSLVIVVLYAGALSNDFVNMDDDLYVTANDMVKSGLNSSSIKWAFTSFHSANWHPLTWLSHMLDVRMFGLHPAGHHLTSVMLHIANTLLLCIFLRKAAGFRWRSISVALLFAVHPLHVESVAWVAERKDVLCAFLGMSALLAYLHYTKAPGPGRYALVILLLALGLMAKPMLVTLPFVFLLLDYWPLGRFRANGEPSAVAAGDTATVPRRGLLLEKAPLLALTIASCVITFIAQRKGSAVIPFSRSPFLLNAGNALMAYAAYVLKMFWPRGLAVFYPFDADTVTVRRVAAVSLFMVAVTLLAVREGRRRPYLIFGWLWFVGTLVPVIGLVRIGDQSMADRYSYLPLIGLFIAVVWGVSEVSARWRLGKAALPVCALMLLTALSITSRYQLRHWRNSITLFEHALKVSGDTWLAHNNLGLALKKEGQLDDALRHYTEALRVRPDSAITYNNIGNIYRMLGQTEKSAVFLKEAITIDPSLMEPHYNLCLTYYILGRKDLALSEYRILMASDPDMARELYAVIR